MLSSRTISLLVLTLAARVCAGHAADASPTSPDAGQACTLRIHVDGLRNQNGVVGAAIFKSADGWPEDMKKALNHWPTPIPVGAHEATAVMENLPPGDYGVVVIHDENRNQKLDRNFLGIPKEGFGFANNPHVGLTAAPYKAAIVHVTCPVTQIAIHLIYK